MSSNTLQTLTRTSHTILISFSHMSGYSILLPVQVSCQTIRLPASSTQPNREESRWAKARSVTAPVKPFSRERSAKPTLRTRIIAWLLAPERGGVLFLKDKPTALSSSEQLQTHISSRYKNNNKKMFSQSNRKLLSPLYLHF